MKRLPSLDLLADGPQRGLGWWLFGVGLATCLISGAWALHRADAAALSRLPGLAWRFGAGAPTPANRTIARSGGASSPVDQPAGAGDAWRLLLALDVAAGDRPARLLWLQPSPDGRHLRARVQVADLPAMRRWLQALTAQHPFEAAVLLRHEWVGEAAGQPPVLQFEVEVDWQSRTAAGPDAVKPRPCG
jgi:hypothetical protein